MSNPGVTTIRTELVGLVSVNDHGGSSASPDNAAAIDAAVAEAASIGAVVVFPDPGAYTTSGNTISVPVGVMFATGAKLRSINGITRHTLIISAAGCRFYGGEIDGNSANNTNTSLVSLQVINDDFRWYGAPYFHDSPGGPVWIHDASEVWLHNPKFRNHQGTSIFAESVTGDRIGLHLIDVDIDRSTMNPATGTGYGVQIHKDATSTSYRNIEVTGTIRMPLNPTNSQLTFEVWGGCQEVRVDIVTYGGTFGASFDRAHDVAGTVNARAGKNIGVELAYPTDTPQEGHINLRGVIDGSDEAGNKITGGGLSISNTKPAEFILDFDIDNCGGTAGTTTRSGKFINADGFILRGRHRHRIANSGAFEFINCTNYLYDGNLDGRGDDGITPTAQDGILLDHSPNGTIDGQIQHLTRYGIDVYNFTGSGTYGNVDVKATIRDCLTPCQTGSAVTTLGTGLRATNSHDKPIIHTANYTLLPGERLCLVDASAGPVTITLPLTLWRSQQIWIEKIDTSTNVVTVSRAGTTDSIEGVNTITLTSQYARIRVVSNEAGIWYTDRQVVAAGTANNGPPVARGHYTLSPANNGQFIFNQGGYVAQVNGVNSAYGAFYLDAADYVSGAKLRLEATALVNQVAPGFGLTFAMYRVGSFFSGVGARPVVQAISTLIGSLTMTSTELASLAGVRKVTAADFAFPAGFWYVLIVDTGGSALPANCFIECSATLTTRQ